MSNTPTMRILVTGARQGGSIALTHATLSALLIEFPKLEMVITGGATGIDAQAQGWCSKAGIVCMVFPAPWESRWGKASGPIRNGWMIRFGKPDLVIAFAGGVGTEDMIKQAEKARIEVRRII